MHRLLAAAFLVACTAPEPEPKHHDRPDPTTPIDSAVTDTATRIDTSTTPPGTTDTSTTDTAVVPTVDCTVLPPLPAPHFELNGYFGAEDFDFDYDGYAVAVDGGNLAGRDRYGNAKVVATGVAVSASGTRILHDGTWVVADQTDGVVRRIDPVTGVRTVIYSGTWPNGIEVEGDFIYISDFSLGRVVRVNVLDPADDPLIIDTDLSSPNGLILSPDGQVLYVTLSGSSSVLAYDRQIDDTWSDSRGFNDSDGSYQGINVDICGNVYLSDIDRVVRITPDGLQMDLVMESGYLPNMRWGQGVGGFESTTLYAIDWGADSLWAMDIGIPGKPHVMGP